MGVERFDNQVDILVKTYKDAYVRALERLNKLAIAGKDTKHSKAIVNSIKTEMLTLDASTAKWIEKNIPNAYKDGYDDAFGIFAKKEELAGKSTIDSFGQLHTQAIEVLASNLQDSLKDATWRIGREANDIFRKIQLQESQKKMLLGESLKYSKEEMVNKLQNQGITAFKDKANRSWGLDTYSEMCIRTVVSQAVSMGTTNRALENGFDLIIVSEHHPTCELCAPLAGKVFSLTGKTKGYPIWKDYIPRHPRCRHGISIYQIKFDDNAEERRIFSNTSLTNDPRNDREKKLYRALQDKNIRLSNDRKQWKRYKALLPGETPNNLGAFTRMKYSNSGNWNILESNYRSAKGKPKLKVSNNAFNKLIPDLPEAARAGLEKAHSRVVKFGKETGKETLEIISTTTGERTFKNLTGNKNSVQFTPELVNLLDKSDKDSLILVHNHPGSSSFSSEDLNVLNRFKSIKAMTVEGHDGTKYVCSIGNGEILSRDEIIDIRNDSHDKYFGFFKGKVVNDDMDNKIAWKEHSHYIVKNIVEQNNWEYNRIVSKDYIKTAHNIWEEYNEWINQK